MTTSKTHGKTRPLVWCAISGHGYGHAAQVVPVLNELSRLQSNITAILRTSVPAEFFQNRLELNWVLSSSEQDIGCEQRGPLQIDVPATWTEYGRFHAKWDTRVQDEARAIRAACPRFVLADIPHLALAAAAQAAVPAVGLSNLSWDLVLERLQDMHDPTHETILQQIRAAYSSSELMLRIEPGLDMKAFPHVVTVGPVRQVAPSDREALVRALKIHPDEKIVLIGFGGVPLSSVPVDAIDRMTGYHFIYSEPVPAGVHRITSHTALNLAYSSIVASADLIITKPGYSTIVEAVAHSTPVVYVRRHIFADEECLVDYLHRYGRGIELSEHDFEAGRWGTALDKALRLSVPAETNHRENGAVQAAQLLARHFF